MNQKDREILEGTGARGEAGMRVVAPADDINRLINKGWVTRHESDIGVITKAGAEAYLADSAKRQKRSKAQQLAEFMTGNDRNMKVVEENAEQERLLDFVRGLSQEQQDAIARQHEAQNGGNAERPTLLVGTLVFLVDRGVVEDGFGPGRGMGMVFELTAAMMAALDSLQSGGVSQAQAESQEQEPPDIVWEVEGWPDHDSKTVEAELIDRKRLG